MRSAIYPSASLSGSLVFPAGSGGSSRLPRGTKDRVRVALRDSPRPMVSTGSSRQQTMAAPHREARIVATFQAAPWSMKGTAGREGARGLGAGEECLVSPPRLVRR